MLVARRVWSLLVCLALLVAARPARADQVSITAVSVERAATTATNVVRQTSAADWISYDDCEANVALQFTVSATPSTGFVGYASLDGVDCSTSAARATAGAACCSIAQGYPSNGVVSVTAQSLIACLLPDVNECDDTTSTGPNAVTVSFTVNDGASTGDVATLASTQSVDIALRLPNPPSGGVSLTTGDQEVIVELSGTADQDALGYLVYCLPSTSAVASSYDPLASTSSGTTTAGDAGASTDAGVEEADAGAGAGGSASSDAGSGEGGGDAGTSATSCPEYAFPGIDPLHPDPSSKYVCATSAATASSITVPSVTDGVEYVVAVAAYDAAANVGPLSVVQCGTPEPTDTFFTAYCQGGGKACSQGCSASSFDSSAPSEAPLAFAVALASWLARRRRAGSQKIRGA